MKYYSNQLLVTSSGAGGGRVSLVTTLNLLKIASRSVPEKTLKGKSKWKLDIEKYISRIRKSMFVQHDKCFAFSERQQELDISCMSSRSPIITFIKTSHFRYGNELLAPWSILDHSNTINTSHRLLEGIGYNLPDWVCQRTEELSHRLWTKRFCKQLYLLDWVVWCDYDPLRPDLHRSSLCFRNKTEWWWIMGMSLKWDEWP